MTVGELIEVLEKLPKDLDIYATNYTNQYPITEKSVRWDITMEEYKKGYTDNPYIFLEKE